MKRALRTAGVALLFLAGSLALAIFAASLFGVPAADLPAVAVLLAVAGGGSGLLALLLIRPAVLGRLGGVRAQLVGAGLVGSLLLLGMMLAGARAMFISGHDLVALADDADLRGGPLGRFRPALRDAAGQPHRAGAGRDASASRAANSARRSR